MELTDEQKDGLTELINIGYGRAAGSLSELTGYRITLEVPHVSIHQIETIPAMLGHLLSSEVASINQAFSGPISGSAMLLLEQRSALELSRLLVDDRNAANEFDSTARETIIEVGNILLNACLGVFGNLLQVHVTFAVPELHLKRVNDLFKPGEGGSSERIRYGLIVHTRFYVKARDVAGYLVIILGVSSLDRLLRELKNWENRQLQ